MWGCTATGNSQGACDNNTQVKRRAHCVNRIVETDRERSVGVGAACACVRARVCVCACPRPHHLPIYRNDSQPQNHPWISCQSLIECHTGTGAHTRTQDRESERQRDRERPQPIAHHVRLKAKRIQVLRQDRFVGRQAVGFGWLQDTGRKAVSNVVASGHQRGASRCAGALYAAARTHAHTREQAVSAVAGRCRQAPRGSRKRWRVQERRTSSCSYGRRAGRGDQ